MPENPNLPCGVLLLPAPKSLRRVYRGNGGLRRGHEPGRFQPESKRLWAAVLNTAVRASGRRQQELTEAAQCNEGAEQVRAHARTLSKEGLHRVIDICPEGKSDL